SPQRRDIQAVRPAGGGQVARRGEQRQEYQWQQRVGDDQQAQALTPPGVGQPAANRDQDLDRGGQLVLGLGRRTEPQGDAATRQRRGGRRAGMAGRRNRRWRTSTPAGRRERQCWPGGTTPLEPPAGLGTRSFVTRPGPRWPGRTPPAGLLY